MSDVPSLSEFSPKVIPYQFQVIKEVRKNFDYSKGIHEVLLSGAVGSAKSILLAHLALTHCLIYPGATLLIGRKTMPDLKETIFQMILDHIGDDLVEDFDFKINHTKTSITFRNGSKIISRSWADKKFKKFRSLALSAAIIEELTENDDEDKEAYNEIKMRIGRNKNAKENFIISATNPDSPGHWAYKYFIDTDNPQRHVYYSVTTDNPFLPSWYKDQLANELDDKMAQRMIYGKWIEISSEVVYYQYEKEKNYRHETFKPNPRSPIFVAYDFNIGLGKPLSVCLYQYINKKFHFYEQCVIEGQRTEDSLDEMFSRGLFDVPTHYVIQGDSTGRHNDTRNKRSDYDIIGDYLNNTKNRKGRYVSWELNLPSKNPPVRKRHNKVNGIIRNSNGLVRLYVYKECYTLDEGFRLTSLKKGGQYIEDDSKRFQHITTAAGYGICSTLSREYYESNMESEII